MVIYYVWLAGAIAGKCGGTFLLKLSDGFSHVPYSIVSVAAYAASFFCLSKALTGMSLSIAYATWNAVGIVLSMAVSVLVSKEPANVLLLVGICACIAGVVMVNLVR